MTTAFYSSGHYFLQQHNISVYLFDHRSKCLLILSGRIRQAPIVIKGSADIWTPHLTSHGNHDVRFRNPINQLAVLSFFHVNSINLLHQSDCVLVDFGFCFRSSRIEFKFVSTQVFSQSFRDLAATGIMNTYKRYFLHISTPACAAASPHRRLSEPCPWKRPAYLPPVQAYASRHTP